MPTKRQIEGHGGPGGLQGAGCVSVLLAVGRSRLVSTLTNKQAAAVRSKLLREQTYKTQLVSGIAAVAKKEKI